MAGTAKDERGESRSPDHELHAWIYDELRKIAAGLMRGERRDHTLQPTALVNEAYIRMRDRYPHLASDRRLFFGAAARVMRQILVDHARRRNAQKRSPGGERQPLDETVAAVEETTRTSLVALNEALEELAELDPREAQVVELRFFGGMTLGQVADVLGVSQRSVENDWQHARAWLYERLGGSGDTR